MNIINISDSLINSFSEKFIKANINEIELIKNGFIPDKCYTPKLSLIVHCMENIEIFNDEQKGNLNNIINKYGNL